MKMNTNRRNQNLHDFDRYHDTLSSSFQLKLRKLLKNVMRNF